MTPDIPDQMNFLDTPEPDAYSEFASALRRSGCAKCALSGSRTQIVVDRGNPRAKIMVIGEAPGEKEDLSGRAFVGRAGKTFDAVMRGIGLEPDQDMLIANVAKCRPPENRAPTREEAELCMP